MVNKKKKRKDAEKKVAAAATAAAKNDGPSHPPRPPLPSRVATATATTATTATATIIPSFVCHHHRVSCDKCVFAFPTGCLHSLREDERNTTEIIEIMRVFRHVHELLPYLNEQLVRFYLCMSIKYIIGNTSFDIAFNYKSTAEELLRNMIIFYGVIKCGSKEAERQALLSADAEITLLEESQVSYRALFRALANIYDESYHGLVYILNEISPCNCLEAEVERSRLEEEQDTGQKRLWYCSNKCGKQEEMYDEFRCCAGCRISFFCSGRCYRQHWRQDTSESHVFACKAFQELVSFIRGGPGGNST